jgi:hypothetical protein
VLGKYLISDKPMSEEDWARERATVIDTTFDEASPLLPQDQSSAAKPNEIKGSVKPLR